jgi:Fe-S-cluster containining protein
MAPESYMFSLMRPKVGEALKKKHTIFLNYAEALRAIQNDLEQYPPQPLLVQHLAQLILGEKIPVSEDRHRKGLWIAIGEKGKCRLITYDQLPEHLCGVLANKQFSDDVLAKICGCVFQERAYAGSQIPGGERGIWIETGMEDFKCLQCGQCCRFLDYHKELTHQDYLLWQSMERADIMKRVRVIKRAGEIAAYRIWIDPVTNQILEGCPWLVRDSEHNRYVCRIHDVRPKICRQYPGSRKHARMTGCNAFNLRSIRTHKKTA